eukprot:9272161-Ditylum_brightwellii.AAC.3
MALVGSKTHVKHTPLLRKTLKAWCSIIHHMHKHPTSALQLVANYSDNINYSDTCKLDTGGVYIAGVKPLDPIV